MSPSKRQDARLAKLKAAQKESETREQWAYDNQLKIYEERDLLIRALSKVYPSHLTRNSGRKGGAGKAVVCIHTPNNGQLAWTLLGGDEQATAQFRHLEWTDNDWNGDTADERKQRLAGL